MNCYACSALFNKKHLSLHYSVDGRFSDWSQWADCAGSCSNSTSVKKRERTCTNPEPSFGGYNCSGETEQETDIGK